MSPYYVEGAEGSFSVTNGAHHVDTVDDYNVALQIAREENDRANGVQPEPDVRDPDVELDFLDLEG